MTTSNLSTLARTDVPNNFTTPQPVPSPVNAGDAANKSYVDTAITNASLNAYKIYASAVTVATANITLSGTQTINGKAVVAGDRVLAIGQTDAKQNLVYVVAAGAWAAAAGFSAGTNISNGLVSVSDGNLKGSSYVVVTGNNIVGTDNITWTPVSFAINTDSSLTETTGSIGENVLGLNVSEIVPVVITSAIPLTPLTFASQNISIFKTYRLQPTAPTTFNITPPVSGQIGAKIKVINESLFDVTLACAGATFVGNPFIPAGTSSTNYLGQNFEVYSPTLIGVG